MDKSVLYLVPYDFTPVTDAAIAQAISIAERTGATVQLLHVVKDRSEIENAQNRINEVVEDWTAKSGGVALEGKVVSGSIFEDISKIADYTDAQLIVMGTHGAKGLQKLLGSYAIRVITSSSIPFIVVQKDTAVNPYRKIAMPVNLLKESVRVLRFATNIAKQFDAEIHILGTDQSDKWLKTKMKNNIITVRDHLSKQGVRSKVAILPGAKAAHREVLDYGKSEGVELFALAYFTESILPQFDSFAQSLITNEENLPVLIVNAEEVGKMTEYAFIAI